MRSATTAGQAQTLRQERQVSEPFCLATGQDQQTAIRLVGLAECVRRRAMRGEADPAECPHRPGNRPWRAPSTVSSCSSQDDMSG